MNVIQFNCSGVFCYAQRNSEAGGCSESIEKPVFEKLFQFWNNTCIKGPTKKVQTLEFFFKYEISVPIDTILKVNNILYCGFTSNSPAAPY